MWPLSSLWARAQSIEKSSSEDARFEAIYTAEWAWRQHQASDIGEDTPKDGLAHLPDVGLEAQDAREKKWADVTAQLEGIKPAKLSAENQVNFQVYQAQIAVLLAQQRFREYERPINSDTTFWGSLKEIANGRFKTEKDYTSYIGLLDQVPRYFDQQIANMKAGLARGFTPPRITLQGRDNSLLPITDAHSLKENPFYAPFIDMPALHNGSELRDRGAKAIKEHVVPAHQKLLVFLREEYIPGAVKHLGAHSLPDGKAWYQSKIREFTTLELTPKEIHEIGLAEVAKIHRAMLKVKEDVGFKGDLAAFLHFLRTDPQFYAKTSAELLNLSAWVCKQFDGKAKQYFGRMPRNRFTVVPVPADIAPFYTSGRGGPDTYLVNTYDLPSRPLYSLRALTLHESAPGHSWQISLAAENEHPDFRRFVYISAYGEGWALYCETLGAEMGMYETPYDTFGMLSYQMWRACRLVIDTGVHAFGWTREQALGYLQTNTALADEEIRNEVDRYISWPAQALSYYLGQMTIREERARAEKALKKDFDIRAFHDTVLQLGSVPLPVLRNRVTEFIEGGGKGPYAMGEDDWVVLE